MAADTSTAEVLLENVKLNLSDSTNFAAVNTAIKSVVVMPEFFAVGKTTPAVVVSPGGAEVEHDGLSTHWEREIYVHVYTRMTKTPTGERLLVGEANVESLLSIVDKVRKALDRPEPYGGRKPSGSYTAMSNNPSVRLESESAPGWEDETHRGESTGKGGYRITLKFLYSYIDARL